MTTTAAVLTPAQQEAVEFYKGYGVDAAWFISEPRVGGEVEVIALGDGFCWSLLIDADGESHDTEAKLGPFSTGIEV